MPKELHSSSAWLHRPKRGSVRHCVLTYYGTILNTMYKLKTRANFKVINASLETRIGHPYLYTGCCYLGFAFGKDVCSKWDFNFVSRRATFTY